MDEYFALAKKLPDPFRTELSALNPQIAPFVQEIRLRVGTTRHVHYKRPPFSCNKVSAPCRALPKSPPGIHPGMFSFPLPAFCLCL